MVNRRSIKILTRQNIHCKSHLLYKAINNPAINLPTSNYDASKLTTIIMTGTTSLVNAIAYQMEVKGIDYPAEDIGDYASSSGHRACEQQDFVRAELSAAESEYVMATMQ